MSDIKRSIIKKSIQEKGFEFWDKSKRTGKDKYFFRYNGRWYKQVFVKLSRGSGYKTYPQELWKRMRGAIFLDTLEQVKDFLECPMDADDYASILREKHIINT